MLFSGLFAYLLLSVYAFILHCFVLQCLAFYYTIVCPILHCYLSYIALLSVLYCTPVCPVLHCCLSCIVLLSILYCIAFYPVLHCFLSCIALLSGLHSTTVCPVLHCCLSYCPPMHLSPPLQLLHKNFTVFLPTCDHWMRVSEHKSRRSDDVAEGILRLLHTASSVPTQCWVRLKRRGSEKGVNEVSGTEREIERS